MNKAVIAGLKRENAGYAAKQVHEAIDRVKAESPIRGKQNLKIAAGQLAILIAAKDNQPDLIADRLLTLADDTAQDHDYHPGAMVEQVLSPEEIALLPHAQAVVGLIAASLNVEEKER